jgi:drug/metabolite transporter (DMT)-like permease
MSDELGGRDSSLVAHRSSLVHAALGAVALLFSINYIISKLGLRAFHPLTFAYLRVVGAAILLNFVVPERDAAPLSTADRRAIVLYSMLAVVINQSLFLWGLALTSAHVAAILITTVPVFALVAAIVVGRERATSTKIGGILLAAAGALLVVGGEGFEGTTKSLVGDLLIVGNSLSFALYLVLSKPMMARVSARRVVARMFAWASLLMLPIAIVPLQRERWASIPRGAWVALAVVIIGPTVGAYLLNAWALRHADSSLVAAYTYLQPVITVVLAAVFLKEAIRGTALAAGAMIVTGVYISGRRRM